MLRWGRALTPKHAHNQSHKKAYLSEEGASAHMLLSLLRASPHPQASSKGRGGAVYKVPIILWLFG